MTLEKVKCRPTFTYSSHIQGSSTIHRHIILSVGVSNNYSFLQWLQLKLILATHPFLQLKSFLTSSSESQHWKVLAIRCRATSVHNEAKVACSFPTFFIAGEMKNGPHGSRGPFFIVKNGPPIEYGTPLLFKILLTNACRIYTRR